MYRLFAIVIAALACVSARADLATTPLGIAAAAMQPGEIQQYHNDSFLTDVPWDDPRLFYYGDGAAWNPVTECVEFVPSPTGGTPRYLLQYCLGTDKWKSELTPAWGNGHGYDSAAAGPNGDLYFARYAGQVMRYQHATQEWTQLPNLPWGPGSVQSLTWFPGKGLVIVSANGRVALWDGTAWTNIPGAHAWGLTGAWSTLVGDVIYMGSYNSALEPSVYRLDASLTLTQMPAPPILVGNVKSYQTTDGTDLLVAQANGAAWYRFDGVTWTAAGIPQSGAIVEKRSYYVTYIPALDVILTMGTRASVHEMWLIKVGPAAPPPPPPPPDCYTPEQYKPMCPVAVIDPCDQPGVIACDRFDGSPLYGEIVRASNKKTKPYVQDGVLKLELCSECGTDAGQIVYFIDPVGPGQSLYFSFSKRIDDESMKHQGYKNWIMWGPFGGPSYTANQVVMTHKYAEQVNILYQSGGIGLADKFPDGNQLWQVGDFECWYRDVKFGRASKCHTSAPNKWATYYVEIKVGTFGVKDSRVTTRVRVEGEGWKRLHDFSWTLPSKPVEQVSFMHYMTDEPIFVHPLGLVEVDDIIVSTQPLDLALL